MEKNTLQEMCQKNKFPLPVYTKESQSGTPNSPSFVISVMVEWNGEKLVEIASGSVKKKEVEKMAARKMIDRINGISNSVSPAVARGASGSSSTAELSPKQRASTHPAPVENPSTPPTISAPINSKNKLQELLQKSGYPPPVYESLTPRGPAHQRQFTSKCVVTNNLQHVIHQTQGSASVKKEAEMKAASDMLPYIRAMLEGGGRLMPQGPPRIHQMSQPRELFDPDLDENLKRTLSPYSPKFLLREGEGEMWLCLAIAESGMYCGQPAIASHGVGDSEPSAKREAALNLIHNLRELGYVISSS